MSASDETFLTRWSRRKRETAPVKTVVRQPDADVPDDDLASAELGKSAAAKPDQPVAKAENAEPPAMLTEADFLDVNFDALDFASDYTRFMGGNVPDAIRNKALRKLWVSDPVLANMDGLHDYFGDYTDAAVAIPAGQVLQTAYKFGQGFLSDAEAAVWDKLGRPEVKGTTAEAAAVTSVTAVDAALAQPVADQAQAAATVATTAPAAVQDAAAAVAPAVSAADSQAALPVAGRPVA
jgi:Protein of unknown function (DUF3306)